MDFPGLGCCGGKISFEFVRVSDLELWRYWFWTEQHVLNLFCPMQ